jgi:hypothetical protein
MINYRPWGTLQWILSKISVPKWDLVGCLGTEFRSIEVFRRMYKFDCLDTIKLLCVLDTDYDYSALSQKMIKARKDEISAITPRFNDIIEDHFILETHDKILSPIEGFIEGKKNIVLDVSSMPKRFFFPILKTLLFTDVIENILVTYTVPKKYHEGKLARNLTGWSHLPLFSGGPKNYDPPAMLCIGVGFDPMGILTEISPEAHGVPIKFLFPFPAPLPSTQRAWEFVRSIEKGRNKGRGNLDVLRVEAKNPSDTFNRLKNLTNNLNKRIELAPFGPKAISVAMCIFASLTDSEVFYTQPKEYAPDYSEGVSEIYAYCIKLNGKDLYALDT